MQNYKVWLNVAILSGMLASLPALAQKGEDVDDKPTYKSSVQVPESKEGSEKSELPMLRKLARVSEKDAIRTATGKAAGAKYLGTELENEDGNLIYEVKFAAGKQEREIVIDAGNGKVLADKLEKAEAKGKED